MAKKKLPEWATTVTPFSKFLALILFITLPFLCFFFGMNYQQKIDKLSPAKTIYVMQPYYIQQQTPMSSQVTPWPSQIENHQFTFTAADSGKTVTYVITSRFTVELNPLLYPKNELQVTCNPSNTLIPISNLPNVASQIPLYMVRYEGEIPGGKCVLRDRDFVLTVNFVSHP